MGAVWLGYDKTDAEHYLTSTSSFTVPTVFEKVLSKSISELPTKKFDLPLMANKIKELEKQKGKVKEKRTKTRKAEAETGEERKERKEEKREERREGKREKTG